MPRRAPLPDSLPDLAETHDLVVSRLQLRAIGVDRDRIAREVRADRWRTQGPLCVVLHTGPLTTVQRYRAAVIDAGPHAALGGLSALTHLGLRGWRRDAVHVVTRRGRNEPPLPFSVVHESRTLTEDDITTVRGLRLTAPARSAVDGAGWEGSLRTAIGLLAATRQQGLAMTADLEAALGRAGRIRHHRALAAALGDIAGGADALSEIDAVRICRRFRLPAPVQQQRRRGADGRLRYLDLAFALPDGTVLSIEIDGAVHLGPEAWWSDSARSNSLVITGARILRFPAWMVREQPDVCAAQIRAALVAFGALAA